jgi:hypothetical protein
VQPTTGINQIPKEMDSIERAAAGRQGAAHWQHPNVCDNLNILSVLVQQNAAVGNTFRTLWLHRKNAVGRGRWGEEEWPPLASDLFLERVSKYWKYREGGVGGSIHGTFDG